MAQEARKEPTQRDLVRLAAEGSLETFIRLVAPQRVLGAVHIELCNWWGREDRLNNQIVLLPRDHGKSAMVAYRCAWYIAKYPDIRIIYLSSTANLAEAQLKSIKDIITSDIFRYYWPEHVNLDEGKREKWTLSQISIDHPKRKEEYVRDSTVFAGGITTSLTGLHADVVVLDDVVVFENAYTKDGRDKVEQLYSLLNSVEASNAEEWVVGTRYHPNDLYGTLIQIEKEIFNDIGELIDRIPVYEKFEKQVEDRGDGQGTFLWPRQQRYDGKWFGFDVSILAEKKAKYLDRTQFRAQYYNDPNDISSSGINRDNFQYYERAFLRREMGSWYIKGKKLNVYASIDFAFSLEKKADYTALVVIGIDPDRNIYVLDIGRIKAENIAEYYKLILNMHVKWDFRKLRAEINVAQKTIVNEIKNNYIRPNGLALSIEENNLTRHKGAKEERINAILVPRYDNLSIWHYMGGECQTLEDELLLSNPPHDDVKDALASVIEIAIPPVHFQSKLTQHHNIVSHPRFGGIAH